jgi:acyl carrier protein
MTREMIFNKMAEVVRGQVKNPDLTLTTSMDIQKDLGLDSIELVELIIDLEEAFQLSIPDEDVEYLASLGELSDYLNNRIN